MRSAWFVVIVLFALVCVSQSQTNEEETSTVKGRVISLIRQTAAEKRKAKRAAFLARKREKRRKRRQRRQRRQRERRRRQRERRERRRRERERRKEEKENNKTTKSPSTTAKVVTQAVTTAATTQATTAAPVTTAAPPVTNPPTVPTVPTVPEVLPVGSPAPPGKSSRNPCHSNRRFQGDSQKKCLKYVLPSSLCLACPLRPFKANGFFNNCGNIYDLRSDACRAELTKYTQLNPCDEKRAQLVADYDKPDSQMGLDYFVYSICEMCCDCVPMGTKKGEFATREAAGTLMKVDRANCPAHAVADICKVWPNVRKVYKESDVGTSAIMSDAQLKNEPVVCDDMRMWKNRQSQLYKVPQIGITNIMKTFMSDFVDAASCRAKPFWNSCVNLERSQNRI